VVELSLADRFGPEIQKSEQGVDETEPGGEARPIGDPSQQGTGEADTGHRRGGSPKRYPSLFFVSRISTYAGMVFSLGCPPEVPREHPKGKSSRLRAFLAETSRVM
jgi:hypothetical protein